MSLALNYATKRSQDHTKRHATSVIDIYLSGSKTACEWKVENGKKGIHVYLIKLSITLFRSEEFSRPHLTCDLPACMYKASKQLSLNGHGICTVRATVHIFVDDKKSSASLGNTLHMIYTHGWLLCINIWP